MLSTLAEIAAMQRVILFSDYEEFFHAWNMPVFEMSITNLVKKYESVRPRTLEVVLPFGLHLHVKFSSTLDKLLEYLQDMVFQIQFSLSVI